MSLLDAPDGIDDSHWERMLMAACDEAEDKYAAKTPASVNIFSDLKTFKLTPCKREFQPGVLHDGTIDAEELRSALGKAGISERDFEIEKDAFIKRLSTISTQDAIRISRMPQHLASGEANPEWLESRKHRVTGSITGSIYGECPCFVSCIMNGRSRTLRFAGVNKYQSQDDTLESLLRPNFRGNAATKYGNMNEDNAEASFEHYVRHSIVGSRWGPENRLVTGFALDTPGLCVCTAVPGRAMFGMSPDGILQLDFDDGTHTKVLVEYKAPYSRRQLNSLSKIDDETDLYKQNELPGTLLKTGPVPPYYFTQVNYGCGILGLPMAYFVVWVPASTPADVVVHTQAGGTKLVMTPSGTVQITEVPFDKDFYNNKLFPCLHRFWHNRYVNDAVRLQLGVPVPRRSLPPKPRTWFGKRSRDVEGRDTDARKHSFSAQRSSSLLTSHAPPTRVRKRRFKFSERRVTA